MKNLSENFFIYIFILSISIIGGFSVAESQYDVLNQGSVAISNQKKPEFFIDWSAKTFVPADYLGKPLPTFQSTVTVSATALPNANNRFNEMDYTFNWTLDNVKSLSSKTNTAEFTVSNGNGGKHSIYLRIFDKNESLVNTYFFTIPVSRHDIIVYKENGNGLLDDTNGIIYVEAGSEVKFVAKPFFFNNISKESSLVYTWELDGKGIQRSRVNPDKLSLAFPSGLPGGASYTLTISVKNPFNATQVIKKDYKIAIK